MIYIAVVIGVVLISVLIAPFFVGPGGLLQASQSINSKSRLAAMKDALLKRYVEDEAAFKAGSLSKTAWEGRKSFLTNRYIDAARRLDFLDNAGKEGGEG